MSALGQLAAGTAHEINNPINFISASIAPLERDIELLLDGDIDAEERVELRVELKGLLRGIGDGARRTAAIVKGLRTFSRLDEDDVKLVDLHESIESALTFLCDSATASPCTATTPVMRRGWCGHDRDDGTADEPLEGRGHRCIIDKVID